MGLCVIAWARCNPKASWKYQPLLFGGVLQGRQGDHQHQPAQRSEEKPPSNLGAIASPLAAHRRRGAQWPRTEEGIRQQKHWAMGLSVRLSCASDFAVHRHWRMFVSSQFNSSNGMAGLPGLAAPLPGGSGCGQTLPATVSPRMEFASTSGHGQSSKRLLNTEILRCAPAGSGLPLPPSARIRIGVWPIPSNVLSFTATSLEQPASIHSNSGEMRTAAMRLR